MKKEILLSGLVVVLMSCGRYSQVRELPQQEEMKANSRVYGDVGGPARQSKQTYPTPADAAERSIQIKEKLFGAGGSSNVETAPTASAAPADTASQKK